MFYLLLQMFLPSCSCLFSLLCPEAREEGAAAQDTAGQPGWDKSQITAALGDSSLFPSLPRSFHAAQVEIFSPVTVHRFV